MLTPTPSAPPHTLRWGCCASMLDDPLGAAFIEPAARAGFDYLELSLAHLAALPAPAFTDLVHRLSALRCEACNNFFPPTLRLTGPAAQPAEALDYARHALDRAARLGAQIIVFGSSSAKNIPPGFPLDTARHQLLDLLHQLAPIAQSHGITIVLEPISRPESNFINRASEALQLVRQLAHPNIQLLIDYYHLRTENEPAQIVLDAGFPPSTLRHIHLAAPAGRTFPTQSDAGYTKFFTLLQRIGYAGRCSIEAFTTDFLHDAPQALRILRQSSY